MASIDQERVGDFLRGTRESRGWSIEQVSRVLRISAANLEALEESRFADLPVKPYVLGFARAYARLLEVNAETVLARLKSEMAYVPDQQELVFPEPPPERRVPGGILVSLSICALIVVYGTWYYQTAQHHVRRDVVTVPTQVAEVAPVVVTPTVVSTPAATVAIGATAPAAIPGQLVQGQALPGTAAPGSQAGLPNGATPAGVTPAGALSTGLPGAPLPQTVLGTPPVPGARGPMSSPQMTAPQMTAPPFATPQIPTSPTSPFPASAPQAVADAGRRLGPFEPPVPIARGAAAVQAAEVPGNGLNWTVTGNQPGAILLRAVEPSWIEVRAASGEVVHGKLLKAGDTYAVPPRADLRLTTGNAGGLEVLVGNDVAPKLGARGAVIRDIALDATRLMGGTATARN